MRAPASPASDNAARRLRAPLPLVAIALIYLATELWQLATRPGPMIGARIAVYALVFLAALYGSRGAALLWGVVSTLSAFTGAFGVWMLLRHGAGSAGWPAAAFIVFQAVFFAASAIYIFTSRALRAFQQARAAARGNGPPAPPQPPWDGARVTLGRDRIVLVRRPAGEPFTQDAELAAIDRIAVRSQTRSEGLPRVWIELRTASDEVPLLSVTTLAGGFARLEAWLLRLPGFDAAGYRQLVDCGENAHREVWRRRAASSAAR